MAPPPLVEPRSANGFGASVHRGTGCGAVEGGGDGLGTGPGGAVGGGAMGGAVVRSTGSHCGG